jgi:hypothetical protein
MRDWILLDNESKASIFCNRNYVHDIKESHEELVLATNGGKLTTKMTANDQDIQSKFGVILKQ